jgi:uncharacterized protein with PIN domain
MNFPGPNGSSRLYRAQKIVRILVAVQSARRNRCRIKSPFGGETRFHRRVIKRAHDASPNLFSEQRLQRRGITKFVADGHLGKLVRDRRLLMHAVIQNGCCPRLHIAEEQTVEVIRRFNLAKMIVPFTRCLHCNAVLAHVGKKEIIDQLEPLTKIYYQDFRRCTECGQIYWAGSHFEKLQARIERIRKRMTEEFATATELREDRQSKI